MTKLWVVGKFVYPSWQFQGIFSTEEKAVSQCQDWYHFVGPVELDAELPKEAVSWPGCYYPVKE